MCGIVGVVAILSSAAPVERRLLASMRDTMAHRGPDGAGLWVAEDGSAGLAHRRLSIIDLDPRAGQPMATPDGRWQIIFNGEVYNHAELRAELEGLGERGWVTDHSDTEVVLRSFARWGLAGVKRFRGMFAFAVYDTVDRMLWLVRDRVGVKPLYWTIHDGRLRFASEIKALLADPAQPRAVDHTALFHYLSFLTTPAPQTLFAGISKLPGGSWLRLADGQVTQGRWWDAWDDVDRVPPRGCANAVRGSLEASVADRKVADVPVGVFLSGGVDSSSNLALFARGEQTPPKSFSIGYEGEHDSYRNELPWARLMAEVVGADHHEMRLDVEDVIDFLPRMARAQDEPIADPVCVPVYYVSKLARDHGVVVAQVGEGADELFAGYDSWHRSLALQRVADLTGPGWAKRPALAAARHAGKDLGFRYEYARRAAAGLPVFWGGAEAFTHAQKLALLHPDVLAGLGDIDSWDALAPIHADFRQRAWEPSRLNWMTYVDLRLRLPELLLMRVDKMSMATSLEARVPFLDHELVHLALGIPTATKLGRQKWGRSTEPKRVLKAAVRGLIPDAIIDRPKQGFGVPVIEYLQQRLGDVMRKELSSFAADAGLLDGAAVHSMLEGGMTEQTWYVLNLALWWREHVDV